MLYVAGGAYESRTGGAFPYDLISASSAGEPAGEPWDEDDLEALYPAPWERFFVVTCASARPTAMDAPSPTP